MDVNSGDLGQLLSAFGYAADQVEGGTASIQLEAQWMGGPWTSDLKRVKGLLHFKASEGTLVKVKRGAPGAFSACCRSHRYLAPELRL